MERPPAEAGRGDAMNPRDRDPNQDRSIRDVHPRVASLGTRMTDNRNIIDARRRAKALSRLDGRSYQSHLDEIARSTGHTDWPAFVSDPRALAHSPLVKRIGDEAVGTRTMTIEESELQFSDWTSPRWAFLSKAMPDGLVHMQLAGIGLVVLCLMCLSYAPIVGMLPHDDGMFLMMLIIMSLIATHLTTPALLMSMLTMTFAIYGRVRFRIRPPLRIWTKKIREFGLCAGLTASIVYGFPFAVPRIMTSIPVEDVESKAEDEGNRTMAEFNGKSIPLVSKKPSADGRTSFVSFVVMDERNVPPSFRQIVSTENIHESILDSIRRNPVMRLTGRLDCRTGIISEASLETSRSYDGPTAVAAPLRRGGRNPKPAVSGAGLETLCSPDSKR